MTAPGSAPRLGPWLALVAVVAVLAAAPGAWVRATYGAQVSGDEPHYLLTTVSLAEDLDLDVADELADERFRAFHEVDLGEQAALRDDGRRLVPHDPLLPALLAGPWHLGAQLAGDDGGWLAAKLALVALHGALAALALWTAVRRFGARVGAAAVTVGLFAASPPLAQYATQVYPELPAALAVTAVVAAGTGRLARGGLAVTALGVVALPWLAVKYVPVAAVLAGWVLWRLWRGDRARDAAVMVGVLAAAGLAYVGAHVVWYGGLTVYATGAFFQEHGGQLTVVGTAPDYLGRSRRLVGLLLGSRFGLAAWQPAWLLAVPAGVALLRQRAVDRTALAAPFAAGWLTATFVALTMHGWWFPGRQVVVVLPLAVIAVAVWAGGGRRRLAAVILLGGLGVMTHGILLVEGLTGSLTWIVDFMDTANPWYRVWSSLLPEYLPADARGGGSGVSVWTWVLQTAWIAMLGVLGVLAGRGPRGSETTA